MKGYEKYLSFDEYKLQGNEPLTDDAKAPAYVSIAKSLDAIEVVVHYRNSEDNKEELYYRKEWGWFAENLSYSDKNEAPGLTYITNKYIFNDTILQYDFIIEHRRIVNKFLKLSTKTDEYQIFIDSETYPGIENYESLKLHIKQIPNIEYVDDFASNSIEYKYFKKILSNNRLYWYEKNPKQTIYKKGCLRKVYIIDNLGEYGINASENVTNEYLNSDRNLPCE
jgi:hypothetical protein